MGHPHLQFERSGTQSEVAIIRLARNAKRIEHAHPPARHLDASGANQIRGRCRMRRAHPGMKPQPRYKCNIVAFANGAAIIARRAPHLSGLVTGPATPDAPRQ